MSVIGPQLLDRAELCKPDAMTPLAAWLSWLEAVPGEPIVLGLERCRSVAASLGLGKPAPTVVTVAGTNGKGSSVALLESIWRNAGYRVGTYTSPHLLHFNERMRIAGVPLEGGRICAAFDAVERARGDVALTYFEFATLAALYLFEHAELDIAVLEVGLGGRLDAVNIIDADVALIAAIGLDHEDWLGATRELIGREKAGIMRRDTPVVCSDHAVPDSIPATAAHVGAELSLLGVDFAYESDACHWTWWCATDTLPDLPLPALDGAHQLRNAAGVLQVVAKLQSRHPVSAAQISAGLEDVVLSGRFHRVQGRFEYVMDVAHNPQAAEIFTATLRTMPTTQRTRALVGMLKTKNHREFLRPLLDLVDDWYFADLPGGNGARAVDLRDILGELDRRANASCHASVAAAHAALETGAEPGDRILVIGSCLTVGAMMRELELQPGPAS